MGFYAGLIIDEKDRKKKKKRYGSRDRCWQTVDWTWDDGLSFKKIGNTLRHTHNIRRSSNFWNIWLQKSWIFNNHRR